MYFSDFNNLFLFVFLLQTGTNYCYWWASGQKKKHDILPTLQPQKEGIIHHL